MPPRNLFNEIVADHRMLQAVLRELESSSDPQYRRKLAEHVIAELVRHSIGEEQYLYPIARRMLPRGDELVGDELKEHAGAEELMKALDDTDAEAPRFDKLVRRLVEEMSHHVEEMERELLPKLREVCDVAEGRRLGEKFAHSKEIAPTRPHPAAPDRPPASKILGPGVRIIDRMRGAMAARIS